MKKNRRDTDCSAKPPSARAGRTLFSLVIVWLFSAAAVSQAAYVDEVLADKPAGYWRLGDAAPLPPPDVATNLGSLAAAGDGVYAGAYTRPVAGTLAGDTAVAFLNPSLGTGYSGAVNVPNSAALNPDGVFTIEFWAKPSNATASLLSPVNSMSFTSGRAGYLFYQNGATWQLRIGVTTSTTASLINGGTVRANEWQHVVGVYSGGASGTMTLFVDGVQVSAGAATYEVNTDAPFSIGSTSLPNRTFDGAVDEVALYSAALSAGTIAAHFEARTTNAANYASQILLDSPVGYWRLSEPAPPPQPTAENLGSLGTAANGAYINGAIGGQPGAITGDANTAAAFAGDNDKIDVPFHAGLNPSAFTIECWAKVAGGAGNHRSPLTARDDTPPGTTAGYIFYATPGDTWEFWTGTGGGAAGPWHVQGGPPLTEGEWAHLVGTFDGKTKKFYVNGALHAIGETTVIANKLRPLRIGGGATEGAGNFFFNGDVDEAAVYDTVLSPDRVLAHFASGAGMDPIPVAPIIAAEPQTQTVFLGQKISLNVAALGSLPLSHQWKKGGNPIPGATGPAYTIESAALTDAGAYSVEVTNSGGAVSSAEAVVTVLNISIPDITRPPQPVTVYGGGTARFHVVATGSPNLTYQWQFGTANLPDETNATLVVREVQLAQQGDYRVLVTDEAGTTPSAAALLTVIVPPAKSYAAFIMADRPIAYWRLGEATGEVAYDYAGGFNGAYLNGATLTQPGALVDDPDTAAGFIADFQTKVETPFDAALNPGQFTIECWAKVTGGQGNYRSPLTSRAASPVSGYIFYATPADRWEHWTGIGGSWNTILGPPVEYDKWTHLLATYDGVTKRFYINGNEVGNNTSVFVPNGSRPLRIGAGATDDPIGNFFFHGDVDEVAVYGTALSPDRVLAHYGAGLGSTTPPTISVQPASRAVLPGTDVAFSVQASGSLPLSYQWYHNGALLPGETSATLALPSVQKPQEGKYQVTVRNTAGLATSDEATLTVVSVPDLAYQDAVLADGPVSYWRLDETSGEVAVDVMNKYPGAYLNGVTLGVPGAIVGDANPAAQFSAPSQTKVEVAFTPDLNPPQFTVEVWAKVTGGAGNYRSPLTSRADQPQRGYIFYAEPGNSWQFWSGKGDQTGWEVIAGPAIRLGSWTHLSATYDGATKRFYVDGMLAGTSTGLFGPNDENLLRIGGGASENPTGNYFFEGSVDEVAVYDKVLSPERILIHYALGARPTPPPTLQVAQSGNNVVLSWSAAGWVLQENTDLANAGGWQAVPGGTASPVTLSIGTGAKFYRLKKQ